MTTATTRWLSLLSISRCGSETASSESIGRFQFPLWSLIELTFVVTMLCALARIEIGYATAFLTVTLAVVMIRAFVSSGNQRRLRVIGSLVGGLLFLASLWLPVDDSVDFLGWHATTFFLEFACRLEYRSALSAEPWNVIIVWLTNLGNLLTFAFPPLVVWRPWKLSRTATVLCGLAAVLAWSHCTFGHGPTTYGIGYWTWCSSLTLVFLARLVPYSWLFERAEV